MTSLKGINNNKKDMFLYRCWYFSQILQHLSAEFTAAVLSLFNFFTLYVPGQCKSSLDIIQGGGNVYILPSPAPQKNKTKQKKKRRGNYNF